VTLNCYVTLQLAIGVHSDGNSEAVAETRYHYPSQDAVRGC